MLLSFCIYVPSFSFHLYSCPLIFLSYSLRVHSNVHSFPFNFLSFACIFLSCCIHFLQFLSEVVEMGLWLMAGPGDRVQQTVIAKLSLGLSLNNPYNIWHCSKEIFHKTREREKRERERKRQRETEKERKRASELDAKWYGNCRTRGTTGWISLIGFTVGWMCATVFAWLTPSSMDCRVWSQLIAFGGALSLYSVSFTSLTNNSCNTKVVFTILTVTHMIPEGLCPTIS
jgi:hypothetical protein